MAITGSWAERRQIQAGPLQQGTGWNPIHGVRGGDGRNIAPGGSDVLVNESVEGSPDPFDYAGEVYNQLTFGYGTDTGTADRPGYNPPGRSGDRSSVPYEFPSWGQYPSGIPGGTRVRSIDHGAADTYTSRKIIPEIAMAGWENKVHGEVNNAKTSDPVQYEITTSMRQRDMTRAGSQAQLGRDSQFLAPVHSRITGMKIKPFTGDIGRHNDMIPKEQSFVIRPWWARSAGTGDPTWMQPNAAYESVPMTREPPPDPNQGASIYGSAEGFVDEGSGWGGA